MLTFEADAMESQFVEDFAGRALNELIVRPNVIFQAETLFADLFGIAGIADENRPRLSQNQITAVPTEAG